MTPEQFAYWLQGFVELNPSMQQPTPEQWKAIGEHLQTVFVKVTPQVQPAPGPYVASPARDKTPAEILQDAIREQQHPNLRPSLGFPKLGEGIQITC
nr:hypothetical protein [uncultured Pseudomonas sp.]